MLNAFVGRAAAAAPRWSLRIVLASLAAASLIPSAAGAATYYACDCGSGADSQCVNGDDLAAGTTAAAPWRSYERARAAWGSLQPGDAVSFCRGGAFPIQPSASTQWVDTHCTAASPCTIGAYQPPWGSGDELPPRVIQSAGMGFSFADNGTADHEEGYVLRDLELVCTACTTGQFGVFLFNDVDHVLMENLTIRRFGIGVHLAGSNPCTAGPPCDGRNTQITLRRSSLLDNFDQGFLGASDDLLVEDNRLAGNGSGSVFEHNLYLNALNGPTTGIHVLRNELYRSAASDTGSCEGGSFAVHGNHTDLLIEGNYIHEDLGATTPGCWGLGVTPAYDTPEAFVRVVVRGNELRNVGNVAIAVASCSDCVIENNVVEHEQSYAIYAISAPAVGRDPVEDGPLDRLTVRNNSIWVGGAGGGVGIRVGTEGGGHVVVSNAVQSTTATSSWACFSLDLPLGSYDAVDNNVCAYAAGPSREWEQGSGSLATWHAATNFDGASLAAAPGFSAPGAPAYDLAASSAAAPMVGLGNLTRSAPTEFYGLPRGAAPDAGAFQIGVLRPLLADGFETGDTSRWLVSP
jgi:hypothetical protein